MFELDQTLAQLDQLAQDQGHDLHPDVDQNQVQHELHAYLIARGQQVAQDMDLGHVQPNHLIELGRLDAIGQHPDLDPVLAQHLELVAHNLEPGPAHTAPERRTTARSDIPDIGDTSGVDQGQVDHHTRSRNGNKQSKLRDYPDEEWS